MTPVLCHNPFRKTFSAYKTYIEIVLYGINVSKPYRMMLLSYAFNLDAEGLYWNGAISDLSQSGDENDAPENAFLAC